MGSFPWGPHGPQSGPNEVTPNPTPAYVPPASTPEYYAPPPSNPVYYGGGPVQYSGPVQYTGPIRPRRKGYITALILTFLFGPLGLFYATKKGALAMLFLLVAVPVALGVVGVLPGGSPSHPFAILDHSSVMDRMWSIAVVFSMLWSVLAVNRYNAAVKARS
jgi:hypothetical protein